MRTFLLVCACGLGLLGLLLVTPEGAWRQKAISMKLRAHVPEWTWTDVLVGMVPGTWRSSHVREPFEGPVTYAGRVEGSPCPVLWDTEFGPIRARLFDQFFVNWNLNRYENLRKGAPDIPPIEKGAVVVEVGAWVGTFVRRLLDYGASHVVALEPEPVNFACAEVNLAQEIADKRVTLLPVAAWDSAGEARFGHPTMQPNGIPADGGEGFTAVEDGGITVRTATIDSVVAELGLERIDLIQMDIEGTERQALRGAQETLRALAPDLLICVHHLEDDPEVLPQLIEEANPGYTQGGDPRHAYFRAD